MATAAQPLTFEKFEEQYGHRERTYEFWYGEAIPKGMPTWVHGLLQQIINGLLLEAGFVAAASEVELRIESGVRPKPDVIGSKTKSSGCYPTAEWGFGRIYLVDPSDRSVVEWRDGAQHPVAFLAGIPVERIWQKLGLQYEE